MVIPGLLVLADLLLDPGAGLRSISLRELVPHAVALGGYLVLRSAVLGDASWPPSTRYFCPPWEDGCATFALARLIFGFGTVLLFVPSVETPLFLEVLTRPAWLGLVLVALGAGAALVHRQVGWDRRGLFAIGWIALFQLPVVFFAPAPWHVYPPSAGFALLVVWWMSKVDEPAGPWVRRIATGVLVLFALATVAWGAVLAQANGNLRTFMDSVKEELAKRPDARRVLVLDLEPAEADVVEALRRELPDRDLEYHILLRVRPGAEPTVVRLLDDHTFVAEARGRPFQLELDWTAGREDVLDLPVGRTEGVGDYSFTVIDRGPIGGTGESGVLALQ